jgi:uncharacterized repeat protein (TIGR02543 family)
MMNAGDTTTVYTTVTVNDNGNAIAGSISTIWYYAKLPEDPTRSGYIFKGWYTDSSCITELTTLELLDNSRYFNALDYSELYAKWD